jgi:hypothetical protein
MALYSGNGINKDSLAHNHFPFFWYQDSYSIFLFCDLSSGFFVKRGHVIPETGFTAADAGMPRLDGKTGAVIEFCGRTIIIGFRAFASQIEKAVSHFHLFGPEFRGKLEIFIMFQPGTPVMDAFAIGKQGPAVSVHFHGLIVQVFDL